MCRLLVNATWETVLGNWTRVQDDECKCENSKRPRAKITKRDVFFVFVLFLTRKRVSSSLSAHLCILVSFLLRVREAVLHTNVYRRCHHAATSQLWKYPVLHITAVLHPLLPSSSYSLRLSLCSTQSIKPRPTGVLHYILHRNQYCQKTAKSGAKSDFTSLQPCCVCKEPRLIVLSKTKLQSIFSCQKNKWFGS